jgi:hypothetical protein
MRSLLGSPILCSGSCQNGRRDSDRDHLAGSAQVAAVYLVGVVTGKASMPAYLWVVTGIFAAGAMWRFRADTKRV